MKLLVDWAVEWSGNEFTAPELRTQHLSGVLADRGRILTSPVASVDGRIVTTRSGSVYKLGTPSPTYLAYLKRNGIAFDERQPIRPAARSAA